MRAALFLDRDGVINREAGFAYLPEHIEFVPGIFDLVRHAKVLGYFTVVVTNQSGIARGYYSETQFQTLMDWMRARFVTEGAPLDAVYYSPFHPEGIGEYRKDSECRKPRPGMLLQAAAEHTLDLGTSILIGDRCSDMQAAQAAGIPNRILLTGSMDDACPGLPCTPVDTLAEAIFLLPPVNQNSAERL